ncbi:ALF repeat-containing protein [Actinoplanes sp. NBRC 101535]|uniref:ALF repeat-containing protein n=1 Tax=Actinoplanes sp. NBRC 101535 TaxID=3032196 RepID=UPI0024A4591C|nr:ALF repeat-containing protein [Actinoplanes sp. NBRC 101535]GLY01196.1 hypothetical protein Acsp01_15750 [Actinoplanes sp. NBRC 101535]
MDRARRGGYALLMTSVMAVTLPMAAGPAVAAPQSAALVQAAADPVADRYRTLVRRYADVDPRWEVSTAAWSALISDDADAVVKFLSTGGGYEQARARASSNAYLNDLIIKQAILTSTPATSPIVYLTAVRASNGTLAEKDRYVKTGLQEAKDLDAKHSPVEAVKQQAQMDRDYVADLAVNAGGAWVRAAAQRATQKGSDADIQEFFKYGWASAADCDLQAHRMDLAESQLTYRRRLEQLTVAAQQAQLAYEQASEAAKAKAAADARLAWDTAADVAASTQETWRANEDLAARQAQAWAAVREFALEAATQQDWPGIADRAGVTSESWEAELAWARDQAQQWADLAADAKRNAEAIPVISA